jgi:hypothetical protein
VNLCRFAGGLYLSLGVVNPQWNPAAATLPGQGPADQDGSSWLPGGGGWDQAVLRQSDEPGPAASIDYYGQARAEALPNLRQAAIGTDVGMTSWTPDASDILATQADPLAEAIFPSTEATTGVVGHPAAAAGAAAISHGGAQKAAVDNWLPGSRPGVPRPGPPPPANPYQSEQLRRETERALAAFQSAAAAMFPTEVGSLGGLFIKYPLHVQRIIAEAIKFTRRLDEKSCLVCSGLTEPM